MAGCAVVGITYILQSICTFAHGRLLCCRHKWEICNILSAPEILMEFKNKPLLNKYSKGCIKNPATDGAVKIPPFVGGWVLMFPVDPFARDVDNGKLPGIFNTFESGVTLFPNGAR